MSAYTGLLLINKPGGMTSRDVVNRLQWLLKRRLNRRHVRLGHCGTLDRMATGVLAVCTGQATRLVTQVQELPKWYRGRFLLGRVTDSDDITGPVLEEQDVPPDRVQRGELEALLPEFTGTILQSPPRISAVHVDGRRAYKRARRGEDFEIDARPVTIHNLVLEDFACPEFTLNVECGSGTYLRALGRDLGRRLGCGATMTRLERTRIGGFPVEQCVSLDDVTEGTILELLRPAAEAVGHLPSALLDEGQTQIARSGRGLMSSRVELRPPLFPLENLAPSRDVALLNPTGELVALAELLPDEDAIKPVIVLHAAGIDRNRNMPFL